MAQTSTAELIDTLKRELKARGLSYREVAERLGMSEASIKRMFSTRRFTLERLEAIGGLMEMGFVDLVKAMEAKRHPITQLTLEQEQELVSDTRLLLVAVCARNGWPFEAIVRRYAISEHECIRLLARLDRLRLIELLPGNRIRLRVTQEFRWIANGPITRFFEDEIQDEFLRADFTDPGGLRMFLTGMFCTASRDVLRRKLKAVAREFAELNQMDNRLPPHERRNVGLVLAMRPWELPAFKALERD